MDDYTLDHSRAKFALVCVEVDLSQLLQQGTSVNYGDHFVFVLVLYEKLPIFCYRRGKIGHGEAHYHFSSNHLQLEQHMPLELVVKGSMKVSPDMQINGVREEHAGSANLIPPHIDFSGND